MILGRMADGADKANFGTRVLGGDGRMASAHATGVVVWHIIPRRSSP